MFSSLLIRLWGAYAWDADGDIVKCDGFCIKTNLFEK